MEEIEIVREVHGIIAGGGQGHAAAGDDPFDGHDVENLADDRDEDDEHDGAGRQHPAGKNRVVAKVVLREQRHDDGAGVEGETHHRHGVPGEGEIAGP